MINPPFPYNVVIKRRSTSSDPFSSGEDAPQIIYKGKCDWENNRLPNYKEKVQVDKYVLYIPDRNVPVRKKDIIELYTNGETIMGEVIDYIPTNFGLTIRWNNINN